jgi:hypothetical protein
MLVRSTAIDVPFALPQKQHASNVLFSGAAGVTNANHAIALALEADISVQTCIEEFSGTNPVNLTEFSLSLLRLFSVKLS